MTPLEGGKSPSWGDVLGKYYRVGSLALALGVSEEKVAEWQAKGRFLSVETADGHLIFPAFQFDSSMKVIPGILKVWRTLHGADITEWSMLAWMRSPTEDGGNPVDLLTSDKANTARVLELARQAVRGFNAP